MVNRRTPKPLLRGSYFASGGRCLEPCPTTNDIVENIGAIEPFISGLDLAAFRSDYAVVRALEIIAEASSRPPADLKERHPEID
jgi:hypothetical protein